MWSKNKRPPGRRESDHLDRVAELPCSVCDVPCPGDQGDIHEPEQGMWWLSIKLCKDCHTGPVNGWHGRRRIWAVKKMDELSALSVTISRLMP